MPGDEDIEDLINTSWSDASGTPLADMQLEMARLEFESRQPIALRQPKPEFSMSSICDMCSESMNAHCRNLDCRVCPGKAHTCLEKEGVIHDVR